MRIRFLVLPSLMAGMMIFQTPASAAGRCPLGDAVPVTDAQGVVKVCGAFGNVLTVRGFPPGKLVPRQPAVQDDALSVGKWVRADGLGGTAQATSSRSAMAPGRHACALQL